MRSLLFPVALLLGMCNGALAVDLGNQAPVKPVATYPENIPNPERQGGDTIANATIIGSLPYNDSGTTVGYTNNYEATCPYTGTAPDVVYKYVADVTGTWNIDLCGSTYDTKLYVMDPAQVVLACNDDYYDGAPCGVYVSLIENFTFVAGQTYYIVVDGYGSNAAGVYILSIVGPPPPCVLEIPADGVPEGEPPLVDDYIDYYNGGCNTPPYYPFQVLLGDEQGNLVFHGVAGWYLCQGSTCRDTDWFYLYAGPTGIIELIADAEQPTYVFDICAQDCSTQVICQHITVGGCSANSMTITYDPGHVVWVWVASTTFSPPWPDFGNEYDYIVWFSGLEPGPIATESKTWSTVKALYE